MEKLYKILKTYECPTGRIHKGVTKTESEWMSVFQNLDKGDCRIKTDWFMCVGTTVDASESKCVICDVRQRSEQFIAFAKYAKNHYTPRKVEDAFEAWLNRQ